MKKVISILLSVLMIFSLTSAGVSASAETEELKAIVVNDLHYNPTYGNYNGKEYSTEDYKHVPSNGQLWIESLLIIDTFLEKAAQSDSDIVLMPGDLTDHGNNDEHTALAQILAEFETTTGKRVYVVPGNHDYHSTHDKVTPENFAEFYADFGYSEAIARDSDSASYVVELDDNYRLLAVDSCLPGSGSSGIDEERLAWITEQAEKAQKDGKKLISMMHHNLVDHFIFGEMLHPGSFVDSNLGLPEIFAQYNVKYTFTGHTHAQDIKAYTGENGVTIYDVLTSSLNLYPLPYRTVTFGEEVEIRTEIIDSIDMSSKKGIISDNCYELAANDFQAYALACANHGLDTTISSYLSAEKILSLLQLDKTNNTDLRAVIERLVPLLTEILNMPVYSKDAFGGPSLEAAAKELNLDFPATKIKTFKELAIFMYQQYVTGDENFGLLSSEFVLLTASLTTILNILLSNISAEDYAKVLDFLAKYFNLRSLNSFNSYAGDAVSKAKGIDIFVSALANTLLLHFTTDEMPGDNNVTLPGYEEPAYDESSLSLFDKILNFFRTIWNYFLRIFGIGK